MTAKPVVAATDGSEESMLAVEWAAWEASRHGAPLRIVSAAMTLPRMIERHGAPDLDVVTDILARNRDQALAAAAARAAAAAPGLLADSGSVGLEPAGRRRGRRLPRWAAGRES